MSRVVKGVGRAIGSVVKGVGNVVKKIVKSPIGKIIAGAALIYFGGAALMGGLGGAGAAATGSGISGFFTGAGAGLSSAAQGISGAWTALTGGGGSVMGSLSGGLTGASAAGANAVSGISAAAAQGAGAGALNPVVNEALAARTPGAYAQALGGGGASAAPGSQAAMLADQTAGFGRMGLSATADAAAGAGAGAGGGSSGLISNVWNSLGPYGKAAAISGGTQLAGGLIQGYGMQKAQDRQEQLAEDQRARYNANIGGFSYAPRRP